MGNLILFRANGRVSVHRQFLFQRRIFRQYAVVSVSTPTFQMNTEVESTGEFFLFCGTRFEKKVIAPCRSSSFVNSIHRLFCDFCQLLRICHGYNGWLILSAQGVSSIENSLNAVAGVLVLPLLWPTNGTSRCTPVVVML